MMTYAIVAGPGCCTPPHTRRYNAGRGEAIFCRVFLCSGCRFTRMVGATVAVIANDYLSFFYAEPKCYGFIGHSDDTANEVLRIHHAVVVLLQAFTVL